MAQLSLQKEVTPRQLLQIMEDTKKPSKHLSIAKSDLNSVIKKTKESIDFCAKHGLIQITSDSQHIFRLFTH